MTLSAQRKGRVTGSQAGAILGLCPWKSREEVMQEWLYGAKFEGNAATDYGKFHEEHAFAELQFHYPNARLSNDEFIIHPDYDWLGCTPDGYIDGDAVIEIKCPFHLREEQEPDFKSLEDQPHYYAQVQIEMLCTQKTKCYFMQWNRFKCQVATVYPDKEWLEEKLPKLRAFIDEYHVRLDELDRDQQLAAEYGALIDAFKAAKERLDEHKEKMIKLANGSKRSFGPVSVYPVERKGSIGYAKVVKEHMPDLDLEPYRGKPSTSWTVK